MKYWIGALFVVLLYACTTNTKPLTVTQQPSPAVANALTPYLFTDPTGKVFLSWIEKADTVNTLKIAEWNDGNWDEPKTIAKGSNWFVNWADYPLAVSDGAGKFMAHYLSKSGEGTFAYDVKLTTSVDGKEWNEPVVLHDDGKQAEHGFVSFVPMGDQVLAAWLDGRNTVSDNPEEHHGHGHHGEMSIRAAMVDYSGKKIQEWELDNRVCDCCQTAAALTDKGPVIIYRDRSDEEIRDMSIVRLINNQWTEPKPVFADNWNINGCPVNGPRCEAQGNTLAIAWFTMANDNPQVKIIFSSDGGETFGKPITVNDKSAMGRVDLVLLDKETAAVSWMEGAQIKVALVNANGKKSRETLVAASSESRSSGFPQMTNSGKKLMMAWTDDNEKTIKTALLSLE